MKKIQNFTTEFTEFVKELGNMNATRIISFKYTDTCKVIVLLDADCDSTDFMIAIAKFINTRKEIDCIHDIIVSLH